MKLVEARDNRVATQSDNTQEYLATSRLALDQHSLSEGSQSMAASDTSLQHTTGLESLDISLLSQESLDFPFDCDDMWAEMFGMNPQDVTFFPQTD